MEPLNVKLLTVEQLVDEREKIDTELDRRSAEARATIQAVEKSKRKTKKTSRKRTPATEPAVAVQDAS
mgnify:CR=1 FL=1